MTRIFRGVDAGDWEPVRAAMSPDQPFDAWQPIIRGWWSQEKKELGDFRAVRPIHQLWWEHADETALQIFLRLDFERGRTILRALRGPGGRYEFRPEKLPERLELTLAPQSINTYAAWNFRYQTQPRIVYEPSDRSLTIRGSRSSIVARRKPGTDTVRQGDPSHGIS